MGLSMGGTLTLGLAEQYGDEIAGIVLVNPSVHTERPDRFLLPVAPAGRPRLPRHLQRHRQAGSGRDRLRQDPAQGRVLAVRSCGTRQEGDIAKVTQPVLLFRSAVDHVVEPSNAVFILANVSSTDVHEEVLPDSFHVATLDHDAEVIVRDSIAFVRRLMRMNSRPR